MSKPNLSFNVSIQLICVSPPKTDSAGRQMLFGLQGKSQNLVGGHQHPDGSVMFNCTIQARGELDEQRPEWSGQFVHGRPGQRFLYLSWRYVDVVPLEWIKRIKIPLTNISWALILVVQNTEQAIQTHVNGNLAATIKLSEHDWSVQPLQTK